MQTVILTHISDADRKQKLIAGGWCREAHEPAFVRSAPDRELEATEGQPLRSFLALSFRHTRQPSLDSERDLLRRIIETFGLFIWTLAVVVTMGGIPETLYKAGPESVALVMVGVPKTVIFAILAMLCGGSRDSYLPP